MSKKVLILVPGKDARGGVTNYYNSLRKHLPEHVLYLERGARKFPYSNGVFAVSMRLLRDYFLFTKVMLTQNISIVHTNTSFDKKGILRDVIYLIIAKLFRKKTVVFYRGWDDEFADKLMADKSIFYKIFFLKATASIVLAKSFKEKLSSFGHKGPIYVETTTVDSGILRESINTRENFTILYMARVEKEKGVFILLEAFKQLQPKFPDIRLVIGGDGKALGELNARIEHEQIKNVTILGFISGENKSIILANSDVFVFPTYYKEGMPNAVLEAFAFGLPVITRPVAGIMDVFADGASGYLVSSLDPKDFAEKIELLIMDKGLKSKISSYNKQHSKYFISNNVAVRLMNIYTDILS